MRRVLPFALVVAVGCGGDPGASSPRPALAAAPPAPASPAPAEAPPAPAEAVVRGSLRTADGPAAGAFLVFASETTGEAPDVDPARLFADADGAFALDLPVDAYEVVAVDQRGRSARARIDIRSGPARLDLVLEADPAALRELVERGPAAVGAEESADE